MIRFTTLGSVRIESAEPGGASAANAQQAKRIALLAYLAIARPRGAHRRDTILGLLWPEIESDRARSALRQALHGIRKAIGRDAVLSQGTELIELNADSISCDARELEAAAEAGNSPRVLDLYQGELLAGLFVNDAPAFEQWVDLERARVRGLVLESAWRLADEASNSGSVAEVVHGVRVAASLSPLDEAAVRKGMRLLADAGEVAEALALHDRFAAEAWREFEIEPGPETRALLDEIRRPRPAIATASSATSPVTFVPTTVVARAESQRGSPVGNPTRRGLLRSGWPFAASLALVLTVAIARLAPSAESELDPRQVEIADFVAGSSGVDSITRRITADTRSLLASLEGITISAGDRRVGKVLPGTILRGRVQRDDDSFELRAEIIDARTGTVLRSVVSHAASQASLAAVSGEFNDRVAAALSTALYPGWGNALSQPHTYRTYRLFVDGMRRIRAEDREGSIAVLRQAFAEDADFTAAALVAGMQLYQAGEFEAADSIVAAITPRRAELPRVDERLLEWLARSLRGDRIAARVAMQGVVAAAPKADLAWLQLAIDNVETARPAEAIEALDRISPDAAFGEGWLGYWTTRAEAFHLLRDHEGELAAVRSGLRRHPELGILAGYELRALAALGRVDELLQLLEPGVLRTRDPDVTTRQVAQELASHGHAREAAVLLRRLSSQQSSEANALSLEERGSRARTLYLLDQRIPARAIYDSLLGEHPRCLTCVGALGVIAARSGDRDAADKYMQKLLDERPRFDFGRRPLLAARIAATYGDIDRARRLLGEAYAAGLDFDIMTHTDGDLVRIKPDSVYRAFARAR